MRYVGEFEDGAGRCSLVVVHERIVVLLSFLGAASAAGFDEIVTLCLHLDIDRIG